MEIENKILMKVFKFLKGFYHLDLFYLMWTSCFIDVFYIQTHIIFWAFPTVVLLLQIITIFWARKILYDEINKIKPGNLVRFNLPKSDKKNNNLIFFYEVNNIESEIILDDCKDIFFVLEKPQIKSDIYSSLYIKENVVTTYFTPDDEHFSKVKVLYRNKFWWISPKYLKIVK